MSAKKSKKKSQKKAPDVVQVYDGMPMEEVLVMWGHNSYDGFTKIQCCRCSLRHLWVASAKRAKSIKVNGKWHGTMILTLRAFQL